MTQDKIQIQRTPTIKKSVAERRKEEKKEKPVKERRRGTQLVAARGPSVHHSIRAHTHMRSLFCHAHTHTHTAHIACLFPPIVYVASLHLWHLMRGATTFHRSRLRRYSHRLTPAIQQLDQPINACVYLRLHGLNAPVTTQRDKNTHTQKNKINWRYLPLHGATLHLSV